MNLIEQQNILKGLTDEALKSELSQPSGSTPPFLVATELERRKEMRDRYEGEKARKGKTSTVLDDLMSSMGTPGPSAAMAPAGMPPVSSPGGMPQQPPMSAPSGQPGGIAAFADGGLVGDKSGGLDYASLMGEYNKTINARPERTDRARALALLMTGAGMMSGGSSNTLTNIGKGLSAGAGYYSDALNNIDTEQRQALRDALDLERLQNSDELQRMEFGWRKDESAADRALRERELAAGRKPAGVVSTEWYQRATPEERALYDKLNPAPASTAAGANIPKVIDDTFESSLKSVPPIDQMQLMQTLGHQPTPSDIQAEEQKRYRQAEILTYQRLRAAYGDAVANVYAAQAGIDPNDVLTAQGAGGTVDNADPLGLGL